MRFLFGVLLIAVGIAVVWQTGWILRNFGANRWAEAKLGAGGTWTFYKVLGIFLILFAFIIMTGGYEGVLDFVFRKR